MLIRIAAILLVLVLGIFIYMLVSMRGEEATPPAPQQGQSIQTEPVELALKSSSATAARIARAERVDPVAGAPSPVVEQVVAIETTRVVRDVGGSRVPVPVALAPGAEMERMAAQPVANPAQSITLEPAPTVSPAPVLLFQPIVEAAGIIRAEGRTIRLSGVEPVDADRLCMDAAGKPWPCGMAARTALRNLVRGRAIACILPDQQQENIVTQCSVGGEDIAAWLVEQGWAEAQTPSPLARLSDAARAMRRGIHARG
jgi:endonuclease YncB( thermonuclease family)